MSSTKISFLCPSHNHEKYVKFFIESLLAQKNPNWELVIVDDCSTDNNIAEIKKYTDKRIKLIKNPFNMGINCAINNAFKHVRGDIVAFCASDDILLPNYVDTIIKTFENNKNIGLVFCDLQQMDLNNKKIKNSVLRNKSASRYEILKHMFYIGNCMLSPGMAVKYDVFKKLGKLDIPLSQYQDYKINIDLLMENDFAIIQEPIILYRKPTNKSGISATNKKNIRTKNLEESLLMDSFLKIKDTDTLFKIFGDDLNQFNKISKDLIPYILGVLALQSPREYKKNWGYNQIRDYIKSADNYKKLNKLYGFSYSDYLNLASNFDTDKILQKYKYYKKLFNCSLFVIALLVFLLFMFVGID